MSAQTHKVTIPDYLISSTRVFGRWQSFVCHMGGRKVYYAGAPKCSNELRMYLNSVTRIRAGSNPAVAPWGSDEAATDEIAGPGKAWSLAVGRWARLTVLSQRFWSQGSCSCSCCEKRERPSEACESFAKPK